MKKILSSFETHGVSLLFHRAFLTEKLASLGPGNPRLGDSEEDLASDDFQTDDDLDGGGEEEEREEYAITFDLPGKSLSRRLLFLVEVRMVS